MQRKPIIWFLELIRVPTKLSVNQDIDSTEDSQTDNSQVKFNIKLDGVSLNRVISTKFLGVIIDIYI